MFWAVPSRFIMGGAIISDVIIKELKNNISIRNYKNLLVFVGLFMVISINNIIGLCPYVFTATSHLVVTMSLALPFWWLIMIYGWVNMTNHIFTHLVPLGSPTSLSFFIVFVETISNIIRPITLSVRLAANMIAGHLLLSLLREIREKTPYMFGMTRIVLGGLLRLEYAVALIQSYVFITLLSLYLNEIN
jgi:F-type H+-transporting ATPase subunit a